jgi:hypothetical protein
MARFLLGGIVSDIKGSIAGSTFTKHRGTHVIRSKTKQPRANTKYRLDNLQMMSQIAQKWRSLTIAERDYWAAYALARNKIKSKSFPVPYNGFQLFQSIN